MLLLRVFGRCGAVLCGERYQSVPTTDEENNEVLHETELTGALRRVGRCLGDRERVLHVERTFRWTHFLTWVWISVLGLITCGLVLYKEHSWTVRGAVVGIALVFLCYLYFLHRESSGHFVFTSLRVFQVDETGQHSWISMRQLDPLADGVRRKSNRMAFSVTGCGDGHDLVGVTLHYVCESTTLERLIWEETMEIRREGSDPVRTEDAVCTTEEWGPMLRRGEKVLWRERPAPFRVASLNLSLLLALLTNVQWAVYLFPSMWQHRDGFLIVSAAGFVGATILGAVEIIQNRVQYILTNRCLHVFYERKQLLLTLPLSEFKFFTVAQNVVEFVFREDEYSKQCMTAERSAGFWLQKHFNRVSESTWHLRVSKYHHFAERVLGDDDGVELSELDVRNEPLDLE